jgi:hypothetical protein
MLLYIVFHRLVVKSPWEPGAEAKIRNQIEGNSPNPPAQGLQKTMSPNALVALNDISFFKSVLKPNSLRHFVFKLMEIQ